MQNKRQVGGEYEKRAAEYLKEQGYEILQMNYRCKRGEIDIVARESEYLVFVEVKYRSNSRLGLPQEAVSITKQRVISRVAEYYCTTQCHSMDLPCRFDVVAVLGNEIRLFRNAFEYQER
ncbi:MAG: YraN family protein [Roseburia sp.]